MGFRLRDQRVKPNAAKSASSFFQMSVTYASFALWIAFLTISRAAHAMAVASSIVILKFYLARRGCHGVFPFECRVSAGS